MIVRTRSYRGHDFVVYDNMILIADDNGTVGIIVGNSWSKEFVWDDCTVDYDPEAAFFLINYHPICLTT